MRSEALGFFDKALGELVTKHSIACEALTEKQMVDALKQAIACGDFQRFVGTGKGQKVVYLPYAERERLNGRVKELERKILNIKDILEGGKDDHC